MKPPLMQCFSAQPLPSTTGAFTVNGLQREKLAYDNARAVVYDERAQTILNERRIADRSE